MKKIAQKTLVIKDATSGYDKKILSKKFRLPNGTIENFFVDEAKDSVQVFALTENQTKVIIVKQFRPGTEKVEIELPGGGLEQGEDPVEGGWRELKEETSFTGDFHYLMNVPYSPYSTGRRHTVLAYNCYKEGEQDLDPNEFLSVGLIPLSDFISMSLNGKIRGFEALYPAAKLIERIYGVHILT